jgi:hypothetical protein
VRLHFRPFARVWLAADASQNQTGKFLETAE